LQPIFLFDEEFEYKPTVKKRKKGVSIVKKAHKPEEVARKEDYSANALPVI
jgi:hypothetical protein